MFLADRIKSSQGLQMARWLYVIQKPGTSSFDALRGWTRDTPVYNVIIIHIYPGC